ncbi:MAG: tetratricopeptide repeat protein [Geminicoccaceae bacterium]|nr:tetratricopeptide repeat protein [Geminicoccaceae bacterium]
MKSDEFIREVDEELQREKLAVLWKQYGRYVIGVLAIVIGVTIAIVGWQSWTARSLQAQGAVMAEAERAFAAGDFDEAAATYAALASEADGGAAAVAELRRAEALLQKGDRAGAIAALDELARADVDPLLADLGRLQALALQIDEGDPSTLSSELEPLTAADNAWRHTARELQVAVALRAGESARARDLLQALVDDATTPPGIRRRAEELLGALGGKVGETG